MQLVLLIIQRLNFSRVAPTFLVGDIKSWYELKLETQSRQKVIISKAWRIFTCKSHILARFYSPLDSLSKDATFKESFILSPKEISCHIENLPVCFTRISVVQGCRTQSAKQSDESHQVVWLIYINFLCCWTGTSAVQGRGIWSFKQTESKEQAKTEFKNSIWSSIFWLHFNVQPWYFRPEEHEETTMVSHN